MNKLDRLIEYLITEAASSSEFISTREVPHASNRVVMKSRKFKLKKKKKKEDIK